MIFYYLDKYIVKTDKGEKLKDNATKQAIRAFYWIKSINGEEIPEDKEILDLIKKAKDDTGFDKYYYEYSEEELRELPKIDIDVEDWFDFAYHKEDKNWYMVPPHILYGDHNEFKYLFDTHDMDYDRLSDYFDYLEQSMHNEDQVIKYIAEICNEYDNITFINAVNDIFYVRGYHAVIEQRYRRKQADFDIKFYTELMTNTTRSIAKTEKLCQYLYNLNDINITLASMHHIKFKFLVDIFNFDIQDNSYLVDCYNNGAKLYEVLFQHITDDNVINEGIEKVKTEMLYVVGGFDMRCRPNTYERFVLELEKTLCSMGLKKYKYINALKVKLHIVNNEVVSIYSPLGEILDDIKPSEIINMIDRKVLKEFVEYAEQHLFTYPTSYLALANLLIKTIAKTKKK